MNNLTSQVYRIRCITKNKAAYLLACTPIKVLEDLNNGKSTSIIRAMFFEFGINPFVAFSDLGTMYPSHTSAQNDLNKLISSIIAISEWSTNKSIPIEKIEELSKSVGRSKSDVFNLLILEYKIEEFIIPSNEAMKSLVLSEMQGEKYWYVSSYYEGCGYKYLADETSFTSIAFGKDEPLWVGESSMLKAWKSKSEVEAIKMSKRIIRKSDTSPYCFPRYLIAPDQFHPQ